MSGENDTEVEDEWQRRYHAVVWQFGEDIRKLHDSNPWPDQPLLPQAINFLMTELWDRCFSQTEIREAFEDAIADMPRYAAGAEVRP